MKENRVKGEKGAYLAVATALMVKGIELISAQQYPMGVTCIIVSVFLFYIREHHKFNRWNKMLKEV